MTPKLQVRNLSYSYHSHSGETKALSHISFDVADGEFLAVVGPSGCGKSTLLSLLCGLLTPEEGSIVIDGIDRRDSPAVIGYMLQKDHLFEWRSILSNTALGLEIHGNVSPNDKKDLLSMLKTYGLEQFSASRPSELSGGMRQRAALIRTMALKPDILLLDEPFSALDYQTRLTVSADIAAMIRKAEKSVILITHDLAEAISLADRVLILSDRPARVKAEFPIHLTAADHSPLAARRAPEYGQLFNQIWEELSNENN